MGWSCSAKAYQELERIQDYCRRDSGGSSNTFSENGQTYFFEVDGKEHEGGAITGTVYEIQTAKPVGDFRIEPDGKISAFPKLLNGAFA